MVDGKWDEQFVVDVDLDGHQDLLIATGHPWNAMDADTGERLRRTQAGAEWKDVQKDRLKREPGILHFT